MYLPAGKQTVPPPALAHASIADCIGFVSDDLRSPFAPKSRILKDPGLANNKENVENKTSISAVNLVIGGFLDICSSNLVIKPLMNHIINPLTPKNPKILLSLTIQLTNGTKPQVAQRASCEPCNTKALNKCKLANDEKIKLFPFNIRNYLICVM